MISLLDEGTRVFVSDSAQLESFTKGKMSFNHSVGQNTTSAEAGNLDEGKLERFFKRALRNRE